VPADPTGVTTEDVLLPTDDGEVHARWYRPASPDGGLPTPTVVWLHGGGFLFGSIDMPESHLVAEGLAERGCRVLTVDYALTPVPVIAARGRSGHPTPLRQASAVVQEARAATTGRLTVGGASAGACLAAATVLDLHDAGAAAADAAVFVYGYFHRDVGPVPPEIQRRRRGHRRFTHDPRVLRVVNGLYAPVASGPRSRGPSGAGQDDLSGGAGVAVPGGVRVLGSTAGGADAGNAGGSRRLAGRDAFPGGSDLTGFPPSLLVDADYDVFRASSERFAAELRTQDISVDQRMLPGSDHGFLNRPRSPWFAPTLDAIAATSHGR